MDLFEDFEQLLGFAAGILTTVAILPQLIKSWRTKKVVDISPVMFLVLITGVGLWAVYGILKNDWPIIITNSISFLLNFSMLFLLVSYRKK